MNAGSFVKPRRSARGGRRDVDLQAQRRNDPEHCTARLDATTRGFDEAIDFGGGLRCRFTAAGNASATVVYASNVVAANSTGLTASGTAMDGDRLVAASTLGAPDAATAGSLGFYSLGFGGSLTLSFSTLFGQGTATFYEATGGTTYPRESVDVFVFDLANSSFVFAGVADNQNGPSQLSFSGLCSIGCSQLRLVDTSDPADFAELPLADGYDVNAVSVTTFGEPQQVSEPATLGLLVAGLLAGGLARRRRQMR